MDELERILKPGLSVVERFYDKTTKQNSFKPWRSVVYVNVEVKREQLEVYFKEIVGSIKLIKELSSNNYIIVFDKPELASRAILLNGTVVYDDKKLIVKQDF